MILRSSPLLLFSSLLLCIPAVVAREATSFCKCTCFSNSTIIQLGPAAGKDSTSGLTILEPRNQDDINNDENNIFSSFLSRATRAYDDDDYDDYYDDDDDDDGSSSGGKKGDKKFRALTCNDCNRKLCMEHQLPKCKGATEEDVFTTCFQRDSSKDQAVVFIFIIATAGLLLWALLKPWAERWIQVVRLRQSYAPISPEEG